MDDVKPVHRYKAQTMFSFGGAKIEYFPHGPEVVFATEFDAQRLRADTAEADSLQFRESSAQIAADLLAAEQRIAYIEGLLQMFVENSDDRDVIELSMHALNQKSEGESQ